MIREENLSIDSVSLNTPSLLTDSDFLNQVRATLKKNISLLRITQRQHFRNS